MGFLFPVGQRNWEKRGKGKGANFKSLTFSSFSSLSLSLSLSLREEEEEKGTVVCVVKVLQQQSFYHATYLLVGHDLYFS